jgi:hypothetical protein
MLSGDWRAAELKMPRWRSDGFGMGGEWVGALEDGGRVGGRRGRSFDAPTRPRGQDADVDGRGRRSASQAGAMSSLATNTCDNTGIQKHGRVVVQ